MTEDEDPAVEEAKRKQKYLKDSNFVEIRIDTESGENGEFSTNQEGKTVFTPNKQKSVNVSEINIKSDE